jgi:LacI family transcriptional regulator
MRPVTQEDIARKLKVSRITVSKALRGHPDISAPMKELVLKTAGEMGYVANEIARQLTSRTTQTIGVIIPDLENSFFSHVADSIIDAAFDLEYQVILAVSREKEEVERRNIRNLIGKRVDGLLVCLSQESRDPGILEEVKRTHIPLVLFDRALPGTEFSRVVFDDVQGAGLAIEQLVGAGYDSFAHFAGYQSTNIGSERRDAFIRSLAIRGISLPENRIIEGGFEVEDGYKAFMKLAETRSLPQVILAVNDRVALGAYKAIREAGLRIPEDIGVVGFGFQETAEMFNPSLAVITQDPRNMGFLAAQLLIEEIRSQGPVTHQQIRVKEGFLWNQSLKTNR